MISINKLAFVILICLLLAAGCTAAPGSPPPPGAAATPLPTPWSGTSPAQQTPEGPAETPPAAHAAPSLALTYQQPDGNRLAVGFGGLPAGTLDIPLAGEPRWVLAVPVLGGSIWVAVFENGQVQAFQVAQGQARTQPLNLTSLPPGMPPVLRAVDGQPELLVPPSDASPLTHPVLLPDGALAYIDVLGQLRLKREAGVATLAVHALPDARLLADETGRLLFLSGPTEQYPHGVLGDQLEAAAMTLVDPRQTPPDVQVIEIASGDVIEGLAPIWADLDRDGQREIIVTQSNASTGARLVAYREDGSLLAAGDPIGAGFRWRHQLVVGQFIPGGALEIAAVRTPHLGGVVEIYGLDGKRLEVLAELEGYSSHQIGSRNLDGALAADLNGDGQLEIILADQAQTTLAGLQFSDGVLSTVWELPIGGTLRTNLAAVQLPDGRLALGLGHASSVLRLWLPESSSGWNP